MREKIKTDGPACVFARCPQLRCNMVIPHSFFTKYLKNENDPEDGVNYLQKYMVWHTL